jgi:hypothetical protein
MQKKELIKLSSISNKRCKLSYMKRFQDKGYVRRKGSLFKSRDAKSQIYCMLRYIINNKEEMCGNTMMAGAA